MTPSPKPRLLYVLHQYGDPGGCELQTQHLVNELSGTYQIAIAYLDRTSRIVLRGADGTQVTYPADPAVFPLTPYRQPGTEQGMASLLREFRPELIHVQNFVFWPLSLIDQLMRTGARTVVTLYDYYAITPIYTLQGARRAEDVFTPEYVKHQLGVDALDYLLQRRSIIARSLAAVDRRMVLSECQRKVISAIYPLDYQVFEPGIVPFEPLPKRSEAGFRFGFLGTLLPQKGWPLLVGALEKVRRKHPTAELRLCGRNPAGGTRPAGVRAMGSYGWGDLPRIFSEIDVGMIPSVFAETFSIVLSEMWHAGVPAAVADIGALSERVVDGVNGKKFPPNDVDAIAATMNWFIEQDAWRDWHYPKVTTVSELAARHHALYRELGAK
jgi:glycosyltransferase involved in cell wall biosynthesis